MEAPQEPKVPNIAPPGETPAKAPPPLANLRTYEDDIAEAVKGSNLSAAKIFLAEEERRRQRESVEEATSPESPKNRALLAASLALVILAIGGFAYFRFLYRAPEATAPRIDVPLFIRVDKVSGIPAQGRSYRDVQEDLRRLASLDIPDREVHQIALTEEGGSVAEEGTSLRQISSASLFDAIGAFPPGELERSLAPDFFIGVYGSARGPLPFLILEAENVELARAAMLSWEEGMALDLGPIFPRAERFAQTFAGTASSSIVWVDSIFGNRDARVLPQGDDELLIWAFADESRIIVAGDPFIVSEMSSRLARDRELH